MVQLKLRRCSLAFVLWAWVCFAVADGHHPRLLFNQSDVVKMREASIAIPAFRDAYHRLKSSLDEQMQLPIDVPVPKDAGGGYTHEQHKKNYKAIRDAGLVYQISGEEKYLLHAKEIFLAYAALYPGLKEHPQKKEQAPGRLFWQSLNESVWLVYSIQGYDAIVSALSADEREAIEQKVLIPMARFLSDGSPSTFDKIHNHGTWATAAVGMTGYVLGDKDMVDKALLGLDKRGDSGFLRQLDLLFSPDGYYTEGPYYQRYALMPFLLFAKAIAYNDPQRKIFDYRDRILVKATYTAIQLSYANLFFPINDALKDKGLDTVELIDGIAIIYGLTRDPSLLSIANVQHTISISGDGVDVAKGLEDELTRPFPYKSMQLADGAQGKQGALTILRSGYQEGHMAVLAKNTSQGFGHGHFDKLALMLYDNSHEVVTDYGAARFLNVESKYGGHYLKENDAWAKQTIAHNTLVVDERSHFDAEYKVAQQRYPEVLYFDTSDSVDIVSARMDDAYDDVAFSRTIAMIKSELFEHPLVLDVLRVSSEKAHQYDLPLYYKGHIVNVSFPIDAETKRLTPLGDKNGYQFLWAKAQGVAQKMMPAQVTWLLDNRFYTLSAASNDISRFYFVELGANDPNFNLRRESGIVRRVSSSKNYVFVSALEAHGEYNPSLEYTYDSYSSIKNIEHFAENGSDYLRITTTDGHELGLALSYNSVPSRRHELKIDGKTLKWNGFYQLFEG